LENKVANNYFIAYTLHIDRFDGYVFSQVGRYILAIHRQALQAETYQGQFRDRYSASGAPMQPRMPSYTEEQRSFIPNPYDSPLRTEAELLIEGYAQL
jgi:hypothetical protein